jgi:hypothetical protein
MNQSKPEDNPADGNRPQPLNPPPIRYDLVAMLKANSWLCRVSRIIRADTEYLGLHLITRAAFDFMSFSLYAHIDCVEAVDYSIRPPDPAILMGGRHMEFHEQHPLLENLSQVVPNTDGMETYDPPVKFGLLKMDQSYVIAGQFALRLEHWNMFKDVLGMDDRHRQQNAADLQRGLEWMESFRLPELKKFARRTVRSGE